MNGFHAMTCGCAVPPVVDCPQFFHTFAAQPGVVHDKKQAPERWQVFLAPIQGAFFRHLYPGLRFACPGLLAVAPPARRQPRFPCESENTHRIRAQSGSPEGEGLKPRAWS